MQKYFIPLLNKVKKETKAKCVDLIGFSLGGLVSRYYIQSNLYQGDVCKLALVAVPNLGS